jgi:hypothetical protein
MTEDQCRWFNVDAAETTENYSFADEVLVSCQLTKIFHYSEKRNAYWNTTSNLWPGDRAFHFNLDIIKQRIEKDRKMGSYFSIHEIPCLAIAGKEDAIILIDHHPRSSIPFRGFNDIEPLDFPSYNIKEIFNWLNSKFLIYGFITERANIAPLESPLFNYTSRSSGPNYFLNYSKRVSKFDIQYLLKAFQLFHNYLSQVKY